MAKPVPFPSRVIKAFGGQTKLADALNVPVTTVDAWRASGTIPSWRIEAIREAARRRGIRLPHDFPQKEKVE